MSGNMCSDEDDAILITFYFFAFYVCFLFSIEILLLCLYKAIRFHIVSVIPQRKKEKKEVCDNLVSRVQCLISRGKQLNRLSWVNVLNQSSRFVKNI